MKTGTPPRLDGRTINYKKTIEQKGDKECGSFSYGKTKKIKQQFSCYITHTTKEVHKILKGGFKDSPMYNGRIKGVGPRYCPSIEDKIERFSEKESHQLFIEPEGKETIEIYLNGFSTSLPENIQLKALRKIKGLEKVKMFRAGYAIEYDYFPPTQLKHSLETKIINNLFFCGQINGTTGYEEAACQGLIAGINAHQKVNKKTSFILSRSEAYIGVLIDDLITKGTEEPYRMFTSRAEFRLLLRQDNADSRLTEKGYRLGLATKERYDNNKTKQEKIKLMVAYLKKTSCNHLTINKLLKKKKSSLLKQKVKLITLLARPNIYIKDLLNYTQLNYFIKENMIDEQIIAQVEIEIKYDGYLKKERESVKKTKRLEDIVLKEDIDYDKFHSISAEGKEKLKTVKPTTIGQASRISGVSPSDVNVLLVYLGR